MEENRNTKRSFDVVREQTIFHVRTYDQENVFENLKNCLAMGPDGKDEWNKYRDGSEHYARETTSHPVHTVRLANEIKVALTPPNLWLANLAGADLSGYNFSGAFLSGADLRGASLEKCDLSGTHLIASDLTGARLTKADLSRANLLEADLSNADLSGAFLMGAQLLRTTITGSTLDNCDVHGISVWGAIGKPKSQNNLTITSPSEPRITVDDVEIGQFVYLLLHNEKIRNIIDTITSKVVLILGNFSPERKAVLDKLRKKLRDLNFSPVIFDFDQSVNQDTSDTVTLLARMARFVIADLTDPRSVSQELTLIALQVSVAIQPIICKPQKPWSMFKDLMKRSPGLLAPHEYTDIDNLMLNFQANIIAPVEARRSVILP